MKTIILSIVMLFFISTVMAQTTSFSKEYYVEKSQKQKKTGWIILGTGLGFAAIGGLVQLSNSNSDSWDFDFTGAYMAIGGGVVSLASIPFFTSASKYKKMAISVSLNNEDLMIPQNSSLFIKKQSSLCLKVEF